MVQHFIILEVLLLHPECYLLLRVARLQTLTAKLPKRSNKLCYITSGCVFFGKKEEPYWPGSLAGKHNLLNDTTYYHHEYLHANTCQVPSTQQIALVQTTG